MRLHVLAVLAIGCRPPVPTTPAPVADRPDLDASIAAASRHMHQRYESVMNLEDAVAVGDLARARADARALYVIEDPYALRTWYPQLHAVREAAFHVAMAPTLPRASEAAVELGTRCAECHLAIHARFADPAPGRIDAATMAGHQAAAAEMWQGLFEPSDERWGAGAATLAAVPQDLRARITPSAEGEPDDVTKLRDAASRALDARSPGERAVALNEVFVACAHCHSIVRH